MRRAAGWMTSVVLALGALAVPAPTQAGEQVPDRSFQVTSRTIDETDTDGGPPGPSIGDSFTFTDRLFRRGERVGRDAVTCKIKRFRQRVFEAQCFITLVFTGRGVITAHGLVTFRRGSDRRPVLPITGGTGEFEGAEGRFVLVEERGKPTRYRIHLSQEDPPSP